MDERDKKLLIEEMATERATLLMEAVSVTKFITGLVREKAKNVVEQSNQEGGTKVKGKALLHITCFKKESDSYRIMIDTKQVRYTEEEFQEMIEAISLIGASGYDVQKNSANEQSAETLLESYKISM